MANKPTLGLYSFSSCSGCQIAVLNLEGVLAELMGRFDIRFFHLIQEAESDVPVDVLIVEGAITTKSQKDKLIKLRSKAGVVVALGACAVTAGIPAMKNNMSVAEMREIVFSKIGADHISSIKAQPIDSIVKVDYYVRGCPITKEEFAVIVTDILKGKKPYNKPYPVCTECRLNENGCFLDEGRICLGSLAYMGCGAPCPAEGVPCEACRGITDDTNIPALKRILAAKNVPEEEIEEKIDIYIHSPVRERK